METVYTHTVQYYETDKMGITHHSNYARWMEEARVDYLDKIGWPYAKLEEMGLGSPVIGLSVRYKVSTTFADTVTIHTSIASFNGVRMTVRYTVVKADGRTAAEGETEHCFVNAAGRPVAVKRAYPELYAALAACVTPEA